MKLFGIKDNEGKIIYNFSCKSGNELLMMRIKIENAVYNQKSFSYQSTIGCHLRRMKDYKICEIDKRTLEICKHPLFYYGDEAILSLESCKYKTPKKGMWKDTIDHLITKRKIKRQHMTGETI